MVVFVVMVNGDAHAVFTTRELAEKHCSKITGASPRILNRELQSA
jgi:hypothetical protein